MCTFKIAIVLITVVSAVLFIHVPGTYDQSFITDPYLDYAIRNLAKSRKFGQINKLPTVYNPPFLK